MTSIDPQQAASALSDIDVVARRVRQSQIYNLASLIMIMWGGLTFAGYLATYRDRPLHQRADVDRLFFRRRRVRPVDGIRQRRRAHAGRPVDASELTDG